MNEITINVIGAGLAGLSAAAEIAKSGVRCRLISSMPSERAQSVLAEGGINAALNTMGENDSPAEHFADTMKGGCFLESESAVKQLTDNAPEIVKELFDLGAPLRAENGRLLLRNFGGQKKKRTAFAKSSTGKMLMTALIDEVRRYESQGLVQRLSHHELVGINSSEGSLESIFIKDNFTQQVNFFTGCTILCTGGLNGFFEGMTTGTTQNTGNAAALAFSAGVQMCNLEFIQYHPTTVPITGKRMLISEAARGEGGRLFIMKSGKPWYFMEEKYPELGNLMPRDVVSREMYFAKQSLGGEVCLDMTSLDDSIWQSKLSDLRAEIMLYLHIDPKHEPIAVSPGIHFFMGGIRVSDVHETNISGLFAAGEAACKYHGANRLGGNSMLAAVYSGKVAARSAIEKKKESSVSKAEFTSRQSDPTVRAQLRDILLGGMGIVRDEAGMTKMCSRLEKLYSQDSLSEIDKMRVNLGLAMAESALARKESRGAHCRSDYPQADEAFRRQSVVMQQDNSRVLKFLSPDEPWQRH